MSLDCFKKWETAAPFYSKLTNSFPFFRGWLKISFRISLIPENSVYLSRLKGLTSFLLLLLKRMGKKYLQWMAVFSPKGGKLFQVVLIDFFLVKPRKHFLPNHKCCVKEFSAVTAVLIILNASGYPFQWLVYHGLFCVCVRAWQQPPFP